jgi:hypothetical protein
MQEIFKSLKDIVAYGDRYEVSNLGRVRNVKTGKYLKGELHSKGYLRVQLYGEDRKNKRYFVHRLVGLAFIPNPDNKPQVNHKDGNKQNNEVTNLEWATVQENGQHASDTGLLNVRKGEDKSTQAILDEDRVREMRQLHATGKYSTAEIGRMFGVSQSRSWLIINRKAWKHVV